MCAIFCYFYGLNSYFNLRLFLFLVSGGMRFADYTSNFDDLRARIVAENNFSRLISGKYTFVPVHKA